jgi:hypothetical protein
MSAINNGFDVANLLMHSALDELNAAHTFCEKVNNIDIEKIEEPDCFFESPRIEGIDTSIKKHLIKSTVLFQSGMESIIHWIQNQDLTIRNGRTFSQKWENALNSKNVNFDFSDYKSFYENYRIHLVHPDKNTRFETFNNLIFSDVYNGINTGWQAYAAMSEAIGYKHDDNSWQVMCRAHNLPITLNGADYVVPNELIILLNKKYRKYLDRISP